LRQPVAPNKQTKWRPTTKNDIDPLAQNLDLSLPAEGLERALTEERARSPTTPEPRSPRGSEEREKQGRTQPNTMATTAEQEGATSSETTPILNPEQMRQIIASLGGGSSKPKAN